MSEVVKLFCDSCGGECLPERDSNHFRIGVEASAISGMPIDFFVVPTFDKIENGHLCNRCLYQRLRQMADVIIKKYPAGAV